MRENEKTEMGRHDCERKSEKKGVAKELTTKRKGYESKWSQSYTEIQRGRVKGRLKGRKHLRKWVRENEKTERMKVREGRDSKWGGWRREKEKGGKTVRLEKRRKAMGREWEDEGIRTPGTEKIGRERETVSVEQWNNAKRTITENSTEWKNGERQTNEMECMWKQKTKS